MLKKHIIHREPAITVVIPCFNQGRYLMDAIGSARLGYAGPLEVIVVDDGSTEPKAEYWLKQAESAGDFVKVIRQQNRGLSGARNTGLREATGDFVQFLDSDDLIVPGKLDAQVAHFTLSRGLDVSVSNFLLCDDGRNAFSKPDEAIAGFDLTLNDFLYKWERGFSIPIHCALFRRSVLGANVFDEEARAKEDWIFWCTLAAKGARLSYLPGHWAIYRQHGESMRRSYVSMGKNWLKAALKVDSLVARQHPQFFDTAVNWFQQCYRAHPLYEEELNSRAAAPKPAFAVNRTDTLSSASGVFVDPDVIVRALGALKAAPQTPLISVVIPVYNHFEHLIDCLMSLGKQGETVFEVICIDDASPDARVGTLLDRLALNLPGLRVVRHQQNQGISATQNEAVGLARGQFIAFLDCDDALAPGALEEVAKEILRNGTIDYIFSDRYDIDEKGSVIRVAKYGGYPSISPSSDRSVRDDLLDGMVASHLKVIRRDTYLSAGGTSDDYTGCQDWELALKIAEFGKFAYLPQPLYKHRIHLKSVTSSDKVAQFRKTNQLRRTYGKKWLAHSGSLDESQHSIACPDSFPEKMRWFSARHALPLLGDLKAAWSAGMRCGFDIKGPFDLAAVNFLREFNSYFDHIRWDDPAVPGALIGYLWSDRIVAIREDCEKEGKYSSSHALAA